MAVPVSCLCRFLKEFLVRHLPKLSAPFHYLFVRASDTRNPLMGLALLDVAHVIPISRLSSGRSPATSVQVLKCEELPTRQT